MKKNLVKILAVSSIALLIGACQPSDPYKVVSWSELLELDDTEDHNWVLLGQKVQLENVCLQGKYGNTWVVGGATGETIGTLCGAQVDIKGKVPELEGSGWGADVTVKGTVTDVGGRIVLADAKVVVNSERVYNEDRTEYEGGLPVYECPAEYNDRSLWNELLGRAKSGAMFPGYFQIASLPDELVAGQDTVFEVVFPGENTDGEDPDNYSLITVNVPGSVNEKGIENFNKFFFEEGKEKKAGDWVAIDAPLQYDLEKNGGMGYVLDSWGCQVIEDVEEEDRVEILSSWDQVNEKVKGYFDEENIVDLKGATTTVEGETVPDPEDKLNAPFSYLIDDSMIDQNPKDLWKDAYKDILVQVSDPAACGTVQINANFRPSDFNGYRSAIEERLTGLGFELDSQMSASYTDIYTQSSGSEVIRQLVVMAQSESQFSLYYTAPKAELSFTDFAAFKARYELAASKKLSALQGEAVTFTSALPAFAADKKPAKLTFNWMYENQGDQYYADDGAFIRYDFVLEFASAEAAGAALAAYKEALAAANFVERNDTGWSLTGLHNYTSHEFVIIQRVVNNEGTAYTNELSGFFIVHDEKYEPQYIEPLPQSDAELLSKIDGNWAYVAGMAPTAYPATATALPDSFTLTVGEGDSAVSNEANHWNVTKFVLSTSQNGYIYQNIEVQYEQALTNEMINAYVAALSAAGFVQAKFVGTGDNVGFWNASTQEFAIITGASGNRMTLRLYEIHTQAVSSYITIL